jgi:hypothetical protein
MTSFHFILHLMPNQFEILRVEEGQERQEGTKEKVVTGKNRAKHQRRAAKRLAERTAQRAAEAKRGRAKSRFVSDSRPRPRPRPAHVENDESANNRFVWYADSSSPSHSFSVVLTPDMFPPLK